MPLEVPTVVDAADVAVSSGHSCVLRAGGTVRCWGDNRYGQLGYPAT